MSDELELWQSQSAESTRLTARTLEEMEKKMRRAIYDFYAAVICIAIVVVGIAALFPSITLTIGAVLILCGFGFLTYEVISSLRGMPSPAEVSIDYQRALMLNRIEFHRKHLWLRVVALTPGGILFFLGLAAALPKLAPFIYLQLATFLVAIALMVPMHKREAARLQRHMDELDRMQ
jgi:Flp pilus assembly protein TadB